MKKVTIIIGLFISFSIVHNVEAMLRMGSRSYPEAQVITGQITAQEYLNNMLLSDKKYGPMLIKLQKWNPFIYEFMITAVEQLVAESIGDIYITAGLLHVDVRQLIREKYK